MNELTLIIPCYNSEVFIAKTIAEIFNYNPLLNVIFVNDASTDKTKPIIEECIKEINNFILLDLEVNLGKGGAIKKAINISSTEYICFTDADLFYDLKNIDIFYKLREEKLLLFASRNHKESFGSGFEIKEKFSLFYRSIMSFVYNSLVRIVLGIKLGDIQAGFKMFHVNIHKQISTNLICDGFSYDTELAYRSIKIGYRIKELPVSFKKIITESSINVFSDTYKMFLNIFKIKFSK